MERLQVIEYPLRDVDAARRQVVEYARDLEARARAAFPDYRPPPYDPRRYAEVEGIPVFEEDDEADWDAMLVPFRGHAGIWLNSRITNRQRRAFSVGHELAHCWFQHALETAQLRAQDREKYYRTPEAMQLERLCDLGAAELLMPAPAFQAAVEKQGFRAETVRILSDTFDVSLQACAVRMVELRKGAPCAVGFFDWKRQGNEERREYRADRVMRSEGFPFLFPSGKSVGRRSCIYACSMHTEEVSAIETFELRRARHRLKVTAFPLHRGMTVDEPPRVCALFELVA